MSLFCFAILVTLGNWIFGVADGLSALRICCVEFNIWRSSTKFWRWALVRVVRVGLLAGVGSAGLLLFPLFGITLGGCAVVPILGRAIVFTLGAGVGCVILDRLTACFVVLAC